MASISALTPDADLLSLLGLGFMADDEGNYIVDEWYESETDARAYLTNRIPQIVNVLALAVATPSVFPAVYATLAFDATDAANEVDTMNRLTIGSVIASIQ